MPEEINHRSPPLLFEYLAGTVFVAPARRRRV